MAAGQGSLPVDDDELARGVESGYEFLESAPAVLRSGVLVLEPPERFRTGLRSHWTPARQGRSVPRCLDGTLVSDDSDARSLADEEGVPVTGSLGVLVRSVVLDRRHRHRERLART